MAQERVSAFSLYLCDVIDMIRKPGMSSDDIFVIAKKEWDELSRDIKMFYIEKEVKLFVNSDYHISNRRNTHNNHVSFLNFHNNL